MRRPIEADYVQLEHRAQDRGMTACREAFEWSFQEADLLFPFMTYKEKMKARPMRDAVEGNLLHKKPFAALLQLSISQQGFEIL